MARKKKETMDQYVQRRRDESVKFKPSKGTLFASKKYITKGKKENGKVPFFETHAHKLEAGRHPLMALQEHNGLVKQKTHKKIEKMTHKRKWNKLIYH